MTGLGTVINVVAIVVGAGLGAVLGDRLPKRWRELLVSSLALFLLAMGVYQAMQAFTGEFAAAAGGSAFATGFVTATLLFVVGPMAVLGSFADGVQGDPGILAVKSILDGVMSLAFAASLGWGVGLSAVPVLLYQGGLTALASVLSAVMVPAVVGSLTAVG
ncbi:DUF554 family protein, partial [Crossiella equi]|uniref:DUF554 family protein n=1 Tax=Crossiella equi TaxID=130796 RepID=UPI0011776EEC